MRMRTKLFLLPLIAMGLSACSNEAPPTNPAPLEIAPQDFVLLPCGPERADRPCALAIAGGKRIVFGAPAGASLTLTASDLKQIDAVIVFSLRAADLEGLDELRNESWRAGRSTPLLVIGPAGIEDVIEATNKAFEQSDALRIVEEGIPPGGYDAAIVEARAWAGDQVIFDTGDVRVRTVQGGFSIGYNDQAELDIRACGAPAIERDADTALGCDTEMADAAWPLRAPLIVVQNR